MTAVSIEDVLQWKTAWRSQWIVDAESKIVATSRAAADVSTIEAMVFPSRDTR